MGSRKYYGIMGCVGALLLAGTPQSAAAKEQAIAVHPYVDPLKSIVLQVPVGRKETRWGIGTNYNYIEELVVATEEAPRVRETSREELVLLSGKQNPEGTLVYANVNNYVNVRAKATTASDVVGKLYSGCVATVIKDAGDWVYVTSGNVTGYVVKNYLLFYEEAEAAIAKRYSPMVEVTANALNVRAGAGTEYAVLKTFTKGDKAELLQRGTEWNKIRFSYQGKSVTGYVSAKYVKITGELKYGETLAEEKERIAKEKKEAEEAKKKAEEERKAAAERTKREKAKAVADYAKTAVGTAYVWGGTNMSTGVDCSGLCYAAYKKYGYTLPRVSRDMAASSALLSVTPNTTYLKAGDLVFYASGGRVDHVAMYIGNGHVVHASDYNTGVIISKYNYRTPHSAKRVIY